MVSLLVVACLLGPPSAEDRQVAAAKAQRAEELYLAHSYEAAAALIRQAAELDPNPDYLYMWAQAEREAGNCAQALPLYAAYLERAEDLTSARIDKTNAYITECEEAPPHGTGVVFPVPPDPAKAVETSTVTEPPAERVGDEPEAPSGSTHEAPPGDDTPRRRADPLGVSLLTVGSALVAGGATLGFIAIYDRATATTAAVEDDYVRQKEREPVLRWTGLGLLGVGVGLVAGGIARTVVARRRVRSAAWHFVPRPRGAAIVGRF